MTQGCPDKISQYLMIRRRAPNQPILAPATKQLLQPLLGLSSKQQPTPQKNPSSTSLQKSRDEERQYETISLRKDWAQFVLAVTYVSELKEGFKNLLEQVDNGAINIQSCSISSIPKIFRDRFNKPKLLELLKRVSLYAEDDNPSRKLRALIELFQSQPDTEFASCLLIRSIMTQTAKTILFQSPVDYLGNELDLLRDFSSSFQYKLFKIAAISLKMNVEIVYIHEAGEHSENYPEESNTVGLQILKKNDKVEFRVVKDLSLSNVRCTISTESSAKNAIRNLMGEKTDRTQRLERTDFVEKVEKLDRTERNQRTEKFEKEKQERAERLEKERAERDRQRKQRIERQQERIDKQRTERANAEKEKEKLEKNEKEKSDKETAEKERSQRLKERFEKTERSNKTPDLRQKSASKACPRCGQMRKAEEKFCACRKNLGRAPIKPQ